MFKPFGDLGVVCTQDLLRDRDGSLVQALGLRVPILGAVERRQVNKDASHVRVLRVPGRLIDSQGLPEQDLGLAEFALFFVHQGEIVEGSTRYWCWLRFPKFWPACDWV